MNRTRAWPAILWAAVGLGGCEPPREREGDSSDRTESGQANPGLTAISPESTLARFLYLSLASTPRDTAAIGAIQHCYPDGEVSPLFILADYQVLGVRDTVSDTVRVRATVTTVAEGAEGDNGWEVRRAIVVDTTEWSLTRDSTDARWIVCGLADDGTDFQPVYPDGVGVRYRPSRAAITSAVDSIQRVRPHR
jgi:hypothetical protein